MSILVTIDKWEIFNLHFLVEREKKISIFDASIRGLIHQFFVLMSCLSRARLLIIISMLRNNNFFNYKKAHLSDIHHNSFESLITTIKRFKLIIFRLCIYKISVTSWTYNIFHRKFSRRTFRTKILMDLACTKDCAALPLVYLEMWSSKMQTP